MKNIRSFGIVFFALAVSLLVSCEKEEIFSELPGKVQSKTIAFGATCDCGENEDNTTKSGYKSTGNRIDNRTLMSPDSSQTLPLGVYVQNGIVSPSSNNIQTKGSIIESADAIASFNVWATLTTSLNEVVNYFSNVAYNRNESDNVFYPVNDADEYYWPGSGSIDFIAVANTPASGFSAEQNSNDGTLTGNFTYTVPAEATAQPDIMIATANDIAGNNNDSVPLEFRHILSAVNIKIGKVVVGEIRSIKLTGVYNKGTFNAATNRWLIDENSKADYNVVFAGGDKFTSTGNEVAGTSVNADNATFLFIPQEPAERAELIVEFYDGTTGRLYSDAAGAYKPALRGSIAGDIWDMAKTTNYNLSIDESFTLKIEPTGKKLDAHYIISDVNVTVDGIENWQITAKANDNAPVSILPYREANPLAKQGYWTDVEVNASGVETTTSARGSSSYTGSGNINEKFLLFIPENVSGQDRSIEIILSSTNNSKPAETTKVLLQKFPNWTGDIGWEVVDDDEAGKYGFKWTRKVAYIYPYSRALQSTATNFCKNFINTYDAGTNNFATVGAISLGLLQNRAYILLDYSVLNNVSGANDAANGYQNTLDLYNAAGTTSTSQFETIVTTTMKTESGHEKENMFRLPTPEEIQKGCPAESGTNNDLSAIMEYIQKKNRYCIQKSTVSGDSEGNVYIPFFQIKDLKWFLPAYGQFTGVDFTPEDPTDSAADYWSSTIGTTNTTACIGSGVEQDRDLEFKVIAARVNVSGASAASASVDNSSLTGGENGNTNTWVE